MAEITALTHGNVQGLVPAEVRPRREHRGHSVDRRPHRLRRQLLLDPQPPGPGDSLRQGPQHGARLLGRFGEPSETGPAVHHRIKVGVGNAEGNVIVPASPEVVYRVVGLALFCLLAGEGALEALSDYRLDEAPFIPEVVVEGGLGHPGRLADRARRGPLSAPLSASSLVAAFISLGPGIMDTREVA